MKKSALGLSGGQQQRLCIARALAAEPAILLMDEPTSALDPISTGKIEELIGELKQEITIVIVTHNMQQATRIADKTAFFYLGELVEYDDTEKSFPRLPISARKIILRADSADFAAQKEEAEKREKNAAKNAETKKRADTREKRNYVRRLTKRVQENIIMSIRNKYEAELNLVFNKLLQMCRTTEIAIEKSVTALVRRDKEVSREVIAEDKFVDNLEHEIEQDCLKILLMEHPVASDFRDVSAALKMITDLERIADQAADISEIALQFGDEKFIKEPEHIELMAKYAIEMVKDGVQSYVNRDLTLARSLEKRDDKVDELFETVKSDLVALIRADGNNADQAILFMMIAKYLERIADHAVNIGEWVEYAVTGFHKAG